jgi:hypothetical protein
MIGKRVIANSAAMMMESALRLIDSDLDWLFIYPNPFFS